MLTFVLSGGGNRGPLQVGAIKVLIEAGVVPEMVVGSSAGALNGAYLAVEPTLEQVTRMANLWREAGRRKLFTPSPLRSIANLLRGKDHLVANKKIREYVEQSLPPNVRTFGDLDLPLYVTIVHLLTQTLYVYGDDPAGPLVDAALTSSAVPGFFPPLRHNGQLFVDGGVIANLPIRLAVARGATEIWALDLSFDVDEKTKLRNVLEILGYTTRRPLYNNILYELDWALRHGVTVHHIAFSAFQNIALGDFSHTEAMMAEGERAMRAYLARPQPNSIQYPRHYTQHELPIGPPGAAPFLEQQLGYASLPVTVAPSSGNVPHAREPMQAGDFA